MAAKIINMEECGHGGTTMHRIKTTRKTVFLCDDCFSALLDKISNPSFLNEMAEAHAPLGEMMRMRKERAQISAKGQFKGAESFLAQSSFAEVA